MNKIIFIVFVLIFIGKALEIDQKKHNLRYFKNVISLHENQVTPETVQSVHIQNTQQKKKKTKKIKVWKRRIVLKRLNTKGNQDHKKVHRIIRKCRNKQKKLIQ
ncbi:hypothetical protein pb186bvf_006817 [Paramecium bursaria]